MAGMAARVLSCVSFSSRAAASPSFRTTREALEPALARNDVIANTNVKEDSWQ
jgi:hypothetical protein